MVGSRNSSVHFELNKPHRKHHLYHRLALLTTSLQGCAQSSPNYTSASHGVASTPYKYYPPHPYYQAAPPPQILSKQPLPQQSRPLSSSLLYGPPILRTPRALRWPGRGHGGQGSWRRRRRAYVRRASWGRGSWGGCGSWSSWGMWRRGRKGRGWVLRRG